MPEGLLYRVDGYVEENYNGAHCYSYPIIRRTAAGVWISAHGKERFILNDAHKRWAYPTEAEAWVSYSKRKAKQVLYLSRQRDRAKRSLDDVIVFLATGSWPKPPTSPFFEFD